LYGLSETLVGLESRGACSWNFVALTTWVYAGYWNVFESLMDAVKLHSASSAMIDLFVAEARRQITAALHCWQGIDVFSPRLQEHRLL
jgi:hypothetical protein